MDKEKMRTLIDLYIEPELEDLESAKEYLESRKIDSEELRSKFLEALKRKNEDLNSPQDEMLLYE